MAGGGYGKLRGTTLNVQCCGSKYDANIDVHVYISRDLSTTRDSLYTGSLTTTTVSIRIKAAA